MSMTREREAQKGRGFYNEKGHNTQWFIPWRLIVYYVFLIVMLAVLVGYRTKETPKELIGALGALFVFYGFCLCQFRFVQIRREDVIRYAFFGLYRKRIVLKRIQSVYGVMSRVNPVTGRTAWFEEIHPFVYVICRDGKVVDLTIQGDTCLNRKMSDSLAAKLYQNDCAIAGTGKIFSKINSSKKWSFSEWYWYVWGPLYFLLFIIFC